MSPNNFEIKSGPSVHAKCIMVSGLTGPENWNIQGVSNRQGN